MEESKMKHLFWFLPLLFLITGCATYRPVYDISLQSVERPADAKERYGEQVITTMQEKDTLKYSFEDEMVKIIWLPTASSVNFILENKTNHSIKITWDEAAFVDAEGQSHRVIHSGVKYADVSNPQPPSVIIRNSIITDSIIPADNVYYSASGGWNEKPIFPIKNITGYNPDAVQSLEQATKSYVGKTYEVLLPLQIENTVNEYLFTFQVNDVKVQKVSSKIEQIEKHQTELKTPETEKQKTSFKGRVISASMFLGALAAVIITAVILNATD
jgi:hypothetical protein